jgi:hypothetical protein
MLGEEHMQKSAQNHKPMRTTLDLDDQLLRQAKALAASERKSLTQVIEEGLAMRFSKPEQSSPKGAISLPVFHGKGGLLPAARKAKSYRELLDVMGEKEAT